MFYHLALEHEILLHPKHFGPNIENKIKDILYQEKESTCSGKYGFIIAVISVDSISNGEIIPAQGHAMFKVNFKAIVYRPFIGEVVDAVVTTVNKAGIFAEVGPLKIFISSHWIPEDYAFHGNLNPPCFQSNNGEQIGVDDGIRLQILGIRVETTDIFATGSLAGEFLGPISTNDTGGSLPL